MNVISDIRTRVAIADGWNKVPRPEPLVDAPDRSEIRVWDSVYLDPRPMYVKPQVSVGVAYVLWLLLGLIGAHYFYMGKVGIGVLYLLTGGLLGLGWLLDLFTLKGQVERVNRRGRY